MELERGIWLCSALIENNFYSVSAFYAECFNKKIQFNAHIWTKSKFLGMSIGVHNIGQGKSVGFWWTTVLIEFYVILICAGHLSSKGKWPQKASLDVIVCREACVLAVRAGVGCKIDFP